MLAGIFKQFFHLLAGSDTLRRAASRFGMRKPTSFARRFIAGETIDDAIAAARALQSRGLRLTLDHLGENVTSAAEAESTARDYLRIVETVEQAGIDRNLSLKLTALGLDVGRSCALENLGRILERAEPSGFFVRLDMESSHYTDATLEIVEEMWRRGHRGLGVVLQAALRRSERDLARLNGLGIRVRLVKGAYTEPRSIAYQRKADVDAAYERMMRELIMAGRYPAIATHDEVMIEKTRTWAAERGVTTDRFEFQMLYGVRRYLQSRLAGDGYRVRIYVPYGRQWFPYFMRRLGERPANLWFVIRSLIRDRA